MNKGWPLKRCIKSCSVQQIQFCWFVAHPSAQCAPRWAFMISLLSTSSSVFSYPSFLCHFQKHLLNHWLNRNNFVQKLSPMLSTKIAQMVLLFWTQWPPGAELKVKIFLNDFWPKYKMTSHKIHCSVLLPKLLKWFTSSEQNGHQTLKSLSSNGSILSNTSLSDLSTVGTCDIFVYQMRHRVMWFARLADSILFIKRRITCTWNSFYENAMRRMFSKMF